MRSRPLSKRPSLLRRSYTEASPMVITEKKTTAVSESSEVEDERLKLFKPDSLYLNDKEEQARLLGELSWTKKLSSFLSRLEKLYHFLFSLLFSLYLAWGLVWFLDIVVFHGYRQEGQVSRDMMKCPIDDLTPQRAGPILTFLQHIHDKRGQESFFAEVWHRYADDENAFVAFDAFKTMVIDELGKHANVTDEELAHFFAVSEARANFFPLLRVLNNFLCDKHGVYWDYVYKFLVFVGGYMTRSFGSTFTRKKKEIDSKLGFSKFGFGNRVNISLSGLKFKENPIYYKEQDWDDDDPPDVRPELYLRTLHDQSLQEFVPDAFVIQEIQHTMKVMNERAREIEDDHGPFLRLPNADMRKCFCDQITNILSMMAARDHLAMNCTGGYKEYKFCWGMTYEVSKTMKSDGVPINQKLRVLLIREDHLIEEAWWKREPSDINIPDIPYFHERWKNLRLLGSILRKQERYPAILKDVRDSLDSSLHDSPLRRKACESCKTSDTDELCDCPETYKALFFAKYEDRMQKLPQGDSLFEQIKYDTDFSKKYEFGEPCTYLLPDLLMRLSNLGGEEEDDAEEVVQEWSEDDVDKDHFYENIVNIMRYEDVYKSVKVSRTYVAGRGLVIPVRHLS